MEPKALSAALKAEREANKQLVIHDHGIWLPWNHKVAKAASAAQIPRVVSPRGMLEPWALGYGALKKKLAWRMYQKSDLQTAALLHATSEQEAENFAKLGLTPPVMIAPNGITVPTQEYTRRSKPEQRRTILFLSRLHPKKGLLDLVAAWEQINDPDWHIRIIGPDEKSHRAEVQNAISAAGLTSSINIEPALAGGSKWQAYTDADLFILPSYSENFGLVVAEALAMGTPVITTTATPWRELDEQRCGWWVATGVASMTETLRFAISRSPAERALMGIAGKGLIRERYGWPAIATNMLPAYQKLL
jgi:glycosyltransferase involved in cell wall biosynthesis